MCKSVKKEKETLEKEKSPPTCLPFASVLLSLRSPHCDDLWFTFVNKLLLCVTFCFYSSLAHRLVILDVLSLRGQLHSDLPVRLNKSWQSIFCGTFPESIPGIIHFKKTYNKDCPPEYFFAKQWSSLFNKVILKQPCREAGLLNSEILVIHLADLIQNMLLVGLWIPKPDSFLLVVTEPGQNCCLLPVKTPKI